MLCLSHSCLRSGTAVKELETWSYPYCSEESLFKCTGGFAFRDAFYGWRNLLTLWWSQHRQVTWTRSLQNQKSGFQDRLNQAPAPETFNAAAIQQQLKHSGLRNRNNLPSTLPVSKLAEQLDGWWGSTIKADYLFLLIWPTIFHVLIPFLSF